MTNRFRLSGTLASRLEESGISSDAVLRRAGLSFGLFKQSKIFLTTEEMFALHRAIHDVSGNPVIGLKLGSDFGCSVKFGARHNRLFFRAEDMAQPFVTHNAELLELLAPQLEIQLSQLAADSLKTQVKTILKKLLAGNRPRLQDVAGELRLSTRTLQRKLLEEGLTFHTLME